MCVASHLAHVLSLGLRSSQVSSVRGYICEVITEVVAIATKVEPATGTLARCDFFWASSNLLINSGMLFVVS